MEKGHSASTFTIALKLTILCFISVLLLSIIDYFSDPIIKSNEKKIEIQTNEKLFPLGKRFERKNFNSINTDLQKLYYFYNVMDDNDNIIGYIVSTIGAGYGGRMKIIIAFDSNLKILNAKLLTDNESPNIGKKAEKSKYMEKFVGMNSDIKPFPVNKNMLAQEDRDSVTGATITYNGIAEAISSAIVLLEKEIRK
jgi:Na+-translocating ferredoxin:NAD+ oxidoreductase subunit G